MRDLLRKIWNGFKTGIGFAAGVAVFIAILAGLGYVFPTVFGPEAYAQEPVRVQMVP